MAGPPRPQHNIPTPLGAVPLQTAIEAPLSILWACRRKTEDFVKGSLRGCSLTVTEAVQLGQGGADLLE